MASQRPPGRDLPGEPAGIPTLYPDLDPLQLERFLTDHDYAPAAQRIELARECIASDPHDPGGYQRLIELYSGLGDYKSALATAERLQKLFEPKMDERALYCLRQNPQRARLIDSGQYDPAADNRRRIAELRRRV